MKHEKKSSVFVIIGEEVVDSDIKAIHLINEALRISSPRMVRENFKFVFDSNRWKKKYNLKLS